MELRLLRYFLAVSQELHYGRAAARLHISTPTLSQQIKLLEREVGAPLLLRGSRGVELTAAGAVLRVEAARTLRAAADALRETRRAAGLDEPALRLGLLNGVPEWIPLGIEALVPGVRLVLTGGSTADQLERLTRDEIDLALVRAPVELPDGQRLAEVGREPLGVLLPAGHPLAASAELAVADLAGVEVVLGPRERAPLFYDALVAQLGDVVVSESSTPHAQLRPALLVRRKAVALASSRAAGQPGLAWRPLVDPPVVSFCAVWRSDSRNPTLRGLVEAIVAGMLGNA